MALLAVGWVFASLTIGVVAAIIVTELLALLGWVESGQSSYTLSLNLITLLVFASLVSLPVVFRKRFADGGEIP